MILKYTVFVFREPSGRAALFVAIQGECRRRAGGYTHRKWQGWGGVRKDFLTMVFDIELK